jgi:SAM-dependent methyltransferase
MNNIPTCLCGQDNITLIPFPSFGERRLYECPDCGTAQLYPLPKFDVNLENIYQDVTYLSNISREEYYGYYKALEEYLRLDLRLPKDISLLDFGSGRCYYQYFFLEEGYGDAHSLEINRHMTAYARQALGLGDIFESADQLQQQYYDIVISNQVFEHLANPLKTLTDTIYSLLKPNGLVCFTVPNWDSLNRMLLGKRWLGYSPEDHIWFFNNKSIRHLFADSTCFELLGTCVRSAVGKPYDGFNPKGLMRSLAYKLVMQTSERWGRGDQLIVTLRKKLS